MMGERSRLWCLASGPGPSDLDEVALRRLQRSGRATGARMGRGGGEVGQLGPWRAPRKALSC